MPEFKRVGFNPIEYFNNLSEKELLHLPQEKRFCTNNYSPLGNRMYLSEKNGVKIDLKNGGVNL